MPESTKSAAQPKPSQIERFVQERHYLKNVSPKTVVWYGHALHSFAGCGLEDPANIPQAQLKSNLQQRIIELRTRRVRAISVNSWLRPVNAYLTWLSLEEHVEYHLRLPKLIGFKPRNLGSAAPTPSPGLSSTAARASMRSSPCGARTSIWIICC